MNKETKYPLIITLALDESSQTYFNRLREKYFPKERNYLQAHLTLFHKLPGQERSAISQTLTEVSQATQELSLEVAKVKSMGRGVAFVLKSERLITIHRQLSRQWHDWLTPQDQQQLWPHVTVQNKVSPEEAQRTLEQLSPSFEPFTATGTGLQLWEYRNGPWEFVRMYPFG
ncbi:MAG: 2'-5' RNA ligase family protein [Tunicatimonas sp.]|uniref:2'-5' RNA ligase family protein n=1 Tax=Tunicatimonas sp. TaxID=1940096 RepID=UPI003C72B866